MYSLHMQIDEHIPLPPTSSPRQKYPFPDMLVGDSFAMLDASMVRNLRNAAHMYARRHPGYKFTIRKQQTGWRIWRIA